MTLKDISKKLVKNNFKQYGLLMGSIIFSITMVGAYGVLQFSPTINNVLVDGGSTKIISLIMFCFTLIGITVFLFYSDSIFLKYKSEEIGVFLSLGIKRKAVNQIIQKEFSIVFNIAAIVGMILSIPLAYGCWSLLNIFLKTSETKFSVGSLGMVVDVLFSILMWFLISINNRRFINKVDVIKILRTSDENEEVKGNNFIAGLIGMLCIPLGFIFFKKLNTSESSILKNLSFIFLGVSIIGLYISIVQIASIGDMIKKINRNYYYKNIVFFNLIKQKAKQYTLSIFVSTVLVSITIFGLCFNMAPFIDEYYTAVNDPFDFVQNISFEQSQIDKNVIKNLSDKNNIELTDFKTMNALLIGRELVYKKFPKEWSYQTVVGQSEFNQFTGNHINIQKGSYTLFFDKKEPYRQNSFQSKKGLFYNPVTKKEFVLNQNDPVCGENIFNSNQLLSSFIILNDEDYRELNNSLSDKFRIKSYMFNTSNWKESQAMHNALVSEVVKVSNGKILDNFLESPVFDKKYSTEQHYIFYSYKGNEYKAARCWEFYSASKIGRTSNQVQAGAIYIMLMLFIAIIAFVSSIMVIGLKILSTIWKDKSVYKNLTRLGLSQKSVKKLVTKQISFIYFIPTTLGSILAILLIYEVVTVSSVLYVKEVTAAAILLSVLVFILQMFLFYFIRKRALKECTNFNDI